MIVFVDRGLSVAVSTDIRDCVVLRLDIEDITRWREDMNFILEW